MVSSEEIGECILFLFYLVYEEFVGYSFNAQSFGGIMPLVFLPCRSLSYFALSFISVKCSVQLTLVYQGSNGSYGTGVVSV